MKVAEAIGKTLAARGVEAFFGLVGSGNFAVTNALHAAGAAFYSSRHECGAIMMADGYARASGEVGVCTVHQGPGFTNTLTGLTEAAKSRTPLVLIAADTPAGTLWANFKIDQSADRESTRLNSSHANISYAVFCLEKKNLADCAHPREP